MTLTVHRRQHGRTLQRITYCVQHDFEERPGLNYGVCSNCLATMRHRPNPSISIAEFTQVHANA